jgi:hypothetical protein
MSGRWDYLEERTRRVDADALRDRRIAAVKSVWDAVRPLGPGLHDAEKVVPARYETLGDSVRQRPPDPLDTASLAPRAAPLPGRVAAVEARWDGEPVHDWFVVLVAVMDDSAGEGDLAIVHHRSGGPSPNTVAAEAGRAPADHLGVPFHFGSPDVPDSDVPRRRG